MAIKQGLQAFTVQEAQNAKLGQGGTIYIDDTVEHTGPFCAIYVVAEAVIDTSECTIGIDDAPATITLVVNTTLYGHFPSIELDSGHVIAYYAKGK